MVCRVFKKKNHQRGIPPESLLEEDQDQFTHQLRASGSPSSFDHKHIPYQMPPCDFSYGNSMHLPQLLSAEASAPSAFIPPPPGLSLNALDLECSQNLMKLTSAGAAGGGAAGGGRSIPPPPPHERLAGGSGDWSILDKLLASHHNLGQVMDLGSAAAAAVQRFPFQYLGCDAHELFKFSK